MASNSSPHHSGNPSVIFRNYDGMKISPKDLSIVWGKDNRYWNIPQNETTVELCQVSWLEVTGLVGETRPEKNYEVSFEVSFNPDAFGWGKYPVFIMVKKGKEGKTAKTKISMEPNDHPNGKPFRITGRSDPETVRDLSDKRLHFGLYEVWSNKWKGGLKIHNVFITELP